MKQKMEPLSRLFVLVMLLFVLIMIIWVPLRAELDFRMEDTAKSLETSRGRERKQNAEYSQAAEELPKARVELERLRPQAEDAAAEVAELKETRKALRERKKELETGKDGSDPEGGQP